jgi:cytochrome c
MKSLVMATAGVGVAMAMIIGMLASGGAVAQEALAKAGGCLNCHAVDGKKIGPSFKDIAAKHKGEADAQAKLVAKISAAKDHPEVKAKGDDLAKIVKWVLAM